MDLTFPIYKVEGDPYEVGFQHGQLAKERIQKGLDIYRQAFLEMANIQWNKAIEKGRTFLPIIRDYDQEAIDEVRGIAEGPIV